MNPSRRFRIVVVALVATFVFGAAVSPADAAVRSINMAALGDSYSSGTGVGLIGFGCDQDGHAYGPHARNNILPSTHKITGFSFIACTGARIGDVAGQLGKVNTSHNVASITIGGNDIGFAAKLSGCFFGACGPDVMSLQADVRGGTQTWSALYNKLVTTYMNIRKKMASTGHLYVLTYPIPFARQNTSGCSGFTATEQNAANALVVRLGDAIWGAVKRANELLPASGRTGNVHFVDWRTGTRVESGYTIPTGYSGAGQKFATYTSVDGLCNTAGRSPFLNGWSALVPNSFHPKANGYAAAANKFAASVRTYQP